MLEGDGWAEHLNNGIGFGHVDEKGKKRQARLKSALEAQPAVDRTSRRGFDGESAPFGTPLPIAKYWIVRAQLTDPGWRKMGWWKLPVGSRGLANCSAPARTERPAHLDKVASTTRSHVNILHV